MPQHLLFLAESHHPMILPRQSIRLNNILRTLAIGVFPRITAAVVPRCEWIRPITPLAVVRRRRRVYDVGLLAGLPRRRRDEEGEDAADEGLQDGKAVADDAEVHLDGTSIW